MDRLRGQYTDRRYFGAEFQLSKARLSGLGIEVAAGVHDYEAFVGKGDGIHLIFYPHKTSAGNHHIRVRTQGKCDPSRVRAAIFALARTDCTFQFPADIKLDQEAHSAAVKAENEARLAHYAALNNARNSHG